jgi:hypothetical protein
MLPVFIFESNLSLLEVLVVSMIDQTDM